MLGSVEQINELAALPSREVLLSRLIGTMQGPVRGLVTAVAGPKPDYLNFFPLTVDYREKTSAAGKFPGGFIKREGRPTTKEICTMRLIDRPIRPLFPEGFQCETQIIAFVLSADGENDPDVLAMNGSFASLMLSGLPGVPLYVDSFRRLAPGRAAPGRSSSRRRGKRAKPSCLRISETAAGLRRWPDSSRVLLMS